MKVLTHTHVSPKFHMYWVVVLSLSQLMGIQVVIDLLSNQPRSVMLLHAAFIPVFMILPLFLYLRHFWAYVLTQITLFLTAGLLISHANPTCARLMLRCMATLPTASCFP